MGVFVQRKNVVKAWRVRDVIASIVETKSKDEYPVAELAEVKEAFSTGRLVGTITTVEATLIGISRTGKPVEWVKDSDWIVLSAAGRWTRIESDQFADEYDELNGVNKFSTPLSSEEQWKQTVDYASDLTKDGLNNLIQQIRKEHKLRSTEGVKG